MSPGTCIEYKTLREVSPETARLAVLEYLSTNGGNAADAARVFGITRAVVYDIRRKAAEGDLTDRSRAPKHQPTKTPADIEDRVVAAKNKTRLGSKRLSIYLGKYEHLSVAPGTIRHIIRRNKHRPRSRRRTSQAVRPETDRSRHSNRQSLQAVRVGQNPPFAGSGQVVERSGFAYSGAGKMYLLYVSSEDIALDSYGKPWGTKLSHIEQPDLKV